MNANEFTPLSFDEWKQRNPDLNDMETECPDCDGDGMGTCPCCGHEDGNCKTCRGSGKVRGANQELYLAYMARDKRAWEAFFGLPHSDSQEEYAYRTAVLRQGEGEDSHWAARPVVYSIHAQPVFVTRPPEATTS